MRPLGELMLEFAREEMELSIYDCLAPVPLHPVRQRDRGFNQSLLLAEYLSAAHANLPVDQSLRRIRPTRAQSSLKSEERAANVRGAFAVVEGSVEGKTILLIDDVITTSGTVSECARALRRAGAAEVDVFAAALACPTVRF